MHVKQTTHFETNLSDDEKDEQLDNSEGGPDSLAVPGSNNNINDSTGDVLDNLKDEGFRESVNAPSVYVKKTHDPFSDAKVNDDHVAPLKRSKSIVDTLHTDTDRLFVA